MIACTRVPGHEFTRKRVGVEGRSSFPPSRWKIERLNEKIAEPVFIAILGCEKYVQLLICVYLALLCDIMLCALLSSIVNRQYLRVCYRLATPTDRSESASLCHYVANSLVSELDVGEPR